MNPDFMTYMIVMHAVHDRLTCDTFLDYLDTKSPTEDPPPRSWDDWDTLFQESMYWVRGKGPKR